MKSITIKGRFHGPVNNAVTLDVFRPNTLPHPYDFQKTYLKDFTEVINDLEPNLLYNIDLTGFTPSHFDIEITGDFNAPNPIQHSYGPGTFSPGFVIQINP